MLEAMKSPQVAARLAAGGLQGQSGSQEFHDRLVREAGYWGPELKTLGINGE